MKSSIGLVLLVGGAFAIGGCGSKQKPAETTTTHTSTTVESDTGEKKKTSSTETTVEQPDGTQTVKRTDSSEHTVPPPPVTPAPIK